MLYRIHTRYDQFIMQKNQVPSTIWSQHIGKGKFSSFDTKKEENFNYILNNYFLLKNASEYMEYLCVAIFYSVNYILKMVITEKAFQQY